MKAVQQINEQEGEKDEDHPKIDEATVSTLPERSGKQHERGDQGSINPSVCRERPDIKAYPYFYFFSR